MEKNRPNIAKICVILVFVAILLVGICVFDDYGLSCDEQIQRQHSLISYRTVARVLFDREAFPDAGPVLQEYPHKYYGVAMQLPLVFAEDMFLLATGAPMSTETVFLMRHLYTFLVYYFALICFYLMLKRLFGSRWLALAGVLMVFLFGQFFAHSFYNIKDLLFASLLMIALCCAERVFASGRKPVWCILFALSGTLLVTSRIVGALLIVLVLLAMLWQDIAGIRAAKRDPKACPNAEKSLWQKLLPYLIICMAYPMWILVTPAAWSDPIGFSLGYIRTFSNYQDPTAAAQAAASAVAAKKNARFYFIKYIALSVPIVNQVFCALGIGAFCARIRKKARAGDIGSGGAALAIMLLLLFGTLLYQAVANPHVYGGWRHAFYLYPIMIVFAVYGVQWVIAVSRVPKRAWLRYAACGLVCASLACNAVRIAVNHPYEYALNNIMAGDTAVARERDNWRLTYYDMVKWVLADADGTARVCILDTTGGKYWIVDAIILGRVSDAEAERLVFDYLDKSDYVLQNYLRVDGSEWPVEGFEEVYAIWVDGQKLAAVQKRIAAAG